eukprot:TRINITY_DN20943_c0_g1_i1.p1 TRINITY_DN20943_c0_g1~~TRINITY_DN20943_c0_g1_i1.p1  ORF type:complete len:1336 (+),score=204.41 TRINITY_DN20943_c0_g1_i1:83-4090(+)
MAWRPALVSHSLRPEPASETTALKLKQLLSDSGCSSCAQLLNVLQRVAPSMPKEHLRGVLASFNIEEGQPINTDAFVDALFGKGRQESPDAAVAYASIERMLGGREHIESFKDRSEQMKGYLKAKIGDEVPWVHDKIFHHMGLEELIRTGEQKVKPIFDALVRKLAAKMNARPLLPRVKGKERGETKIKVRYGGNCQQLSDVVRATLEVETNAESMNTMYQCLEEIVYSDEFNSSCIYVTHLDDRFQRPRNGGYMDFLVLLKIDGYVCELQLNTAELLKVKESDAGHGQYEIDRKNNDDLIYAAMLGLEDDLFTALKNGAQPNASKDMYNLGCLHYAAQHGSFRMVQALLEHEADVFAEDEDGMLPIHRAVLQCHTEVVVLLIQKMVAELIIRRPVFRSRPLAKLSASALEKAEANTLPKEAALSVVRWAVRALPEDSESFWYQWAVMGCSNAFVLAASELGEELLGPMASMGLNHQTATKGISTLDAAIRSNTVTIANFLLQSGHLPQVPHFQEDCTPQMLTLLQQYSGARTELTTREFLQGKAGVELQAIARNAARQGDAKALFAFIAAGVDLNQVGGDFLTAIGKAAQGGHGTAIALLRRFGFIQTVEEQYLRDSDPEVIAGAIWALGEVGPEQQSMSGPVLHYAGRTFTGVAGDGDIFGNFTSLPFGGAFSVAFTARWDSLGKWSRIIDIGNGVDKENIIIAQMDESTSIAWHFRTAEKTWGLVEAKDAIVVGETNRYLCVVSDEGSMKVYREGEMIAEGKASSAPPVVHRKSLHVATSHWDLPPFHGEISDLNIWNEVVDWADAAKISWDFDWSGTWVVMPADGEPCQPETVTVNDNMWHSGGRCFQLGADGNSFCLADGTVQKVQLRNANRVVWSTASEGHVSNSTIVWQRKTCLVDTVEQAGALAAPFLKHSLAKIRVEAIATIGRLARAANGQGVMGQIGKIAACMEDEEADVRQAAAEGLRSLMGIPCKETEQALRHVVQLMRSKDAAIRQAAVHVMGGTNEHLSKHAHELASLLSDSDRDVCEATLKIINRHCTDQQLLESIAKLLRVGVPDALRDGVTYLHFRFVPLRCRHGHAFQMSELVFYRSGQRVSTAEATASVEGPSLNAEHCHPPQHSIDGNPHSKFYHTTLTPLTVTFPTPTTIDQYSYGTGSDCPERDPIKWELQGSNDGVTYVQLHRVAGFEPTRTRKTLQEPFSLMVRATALNVLSSFGKFAKRYLADFERCLEDTDCQVRVQALFALGKLCTADTFGVSDALDPEKARRVAALVVKSRADKEATVRMCVILALRQMGEYSQPHHADVKAMCDDEDDTVRAHALCFVKDFCQET